MKSIKGLTWDHPRGYRPLQAWAVEDSSLNVEWDIQKLEGFESYPINELAGKYDLLIVDNPGIGEAAEKQCLRPLETFLTPEQLSFLKNSSTGYSFDSYEYAGQHWAIPIDAAAQVCALAKSAVSVHPETWQQVSQYCQAKKGRVALSLGGPHALLTFYSISQSLGGKLFSDNDFVLKRDTGLEALTYMKDIFAHQQKDLVSLNPIGLLDKMADGIFDLCPAIFGYINYSTPESGTAIRFIDIPHCGEPALRGSVLGGTGLALSVHCEPTPELIDHIMRYVSDNVQTTLVVENGGQPSNSHAWRDARANTLTHNFFSETFTTISAAYVRPKYDGYIHFQDSSSALIRNGLLSGASVEEMFDSVREDHGHYLP